MLSRVLREASVRVRELNAGISSRDAVDLAAAIGEADSWLSDPGLAIDTAFLRELNVDWFSVLNRRRFVPGREHSEF